jgi:hypothetical protein
MKKFLPLIGLFSIITFSIIEWRPRETIRGEQYEEEEGEGEHEDGMDEIMKLELIKTQDPSLHVIPTERLLKAQQQVNDFLSRALFRTAGLSWTERGANNIGGRTRAILIDKNDPTGNTVFAGSVGGGIWKCTNFKSSNYIWTKVSDNTTNHSITALAQHPSNPMVMYAGTGEGFYNSDAIKGGGVFKSVDGGNTWNVLPVTVPSGIVQQTMISLLFRISFVTSKRPYLHCCPWVLLQLRRRIKVNEWRKLVDEGNRESPRLQEVPVRTTITTEVLTLKLLQMEI